MRHAILLLATFASTVACAPTYTPVDESASALDDCGGDDDDDCATQKKKIAVDDAGAAVDAGPAPIVR